MESPSLASWRQCVGGPERRPWGPLITADEMDRFDEGWRNLNSAEKHQAAFDVVEWESEAVESYNEAEDSDTRARCEQALDIARIYAARIANDDELYISWPENDWPGYDRASLRAAQDAEIIILDPPAPEPAAVVIPAPISAPVELRPPTPESPPRMLILSDSNDDEKSDQEQPQVAKIPVVFGSSINRENQQEEEDVNDDVLVIPQSHSHNESSNGSRSSSVVSGPDSSRYEGSSDAPDSLKRSSLDGMAVDVVEDSEPERGAVDGLEGGDDREECKTLSDGELLEVSVEPDAQSSRAVYSNAECAGSRPGDESDGHTAVVDSEEAVVEALQSDATSSSPAPQPSPSAPQELKPKHKTKRALVNSANDKIKLKKKARIPPRKSTLRPRRRAIDNSRDLFKIRQHVKSEVHDDDKIPLRLPDAQYDELHLYEFFRLPIPVDSDSRADFFLDDAVLEAADCSQTFSLLEIVLRSAHLEVRLRGEALPMIDADLQQELEGEDDPPLPPMHTYKNVDGIRRVEIAHHSLERLVPMVDGLWIYTHRARYLVRSLLPARDPLAASQIENVSRFYAYWHVAQRYAIWGQHGEGQFRVIREMNAALQQHTESVAAAIRSMPEGWNVRLPLAELSENKRDRPIVEALYETLYNPPFLTPRLQHLVAQYLLPNVTRTDPAFDFAELDRQRKHDEDFLTAAQVRLAHAREPESKPTPRGPVAVKILPNSLYSVDGVKAQAQKIKVYQEAEIDGVVYRAGDDVLVVGGSTARVKVSAPTVRTHRRGASQAIEEEEGRCDWAGPNEEAGVAASLWFAIIAYFYQQKRVDGLRAHVRYFSHRRDTTIGSIAHARALVDIDFCDALAAQDIVEKTTIHRVYGSKPPPPSGFFVDYSWDVEHSSFETLRPDDETLPEPVAARLEEAGLAKCASCARRLAEHGSSCKDKTEGRVFAPLLTSKGVSLNDIEYHERDFVYVAPWLSVDRSTLLRQPHRVAQLIRIISKEGTKLSPWSLITVRWLYRRDDLLDLPQTEPRRLVISNVEAQIPIGQLRGTFQVRHLDDLLNELDRGVLPADREQVAIAKLEASSPDLFYCREALTQESEQLEGLESGDPPLEPQLVCVEPLPADAFSHAVRPCATCQQRWAQQQMIRHTAVNCSDSRMSMLSLYSGLDGFARGIESTCPFLETKWAVEKDEEAIAAYRRSRSDVQASHCAVSDYLERAYHTRDGAGSGLELKRLLERCPDAPARYGEVDVLIGGPPCQGFSHVNKAKRFDDLRTLEPFVFLSAVDFYRPSIVMFENVRELQRFVLPGLPRQGSMLSVVTEVLLQLGYACHIGVYQAAQYGTPQSRRRLMIMAVRRGFCHLPARPPPTHSFSSALTTLDPRPYEGNQIQRARSNDSDEGHAPHHAVTFDEATSDLARFGYGDPIGHADQSAQRGLFAWEEGVPIGVEGRETYSRLPTSAFQRAARIDIKSDFPPTVLQETSGHVVPAVSALKASRLANLRTAEAGFGNYMDIPEIVRGEHGEAIALQPPFPPNLAERRRELWWRRIDADDVVTTLRTTDAIDGVSHGPRIHPHDARIISIREKARLQGFRDYDFVCDGIDYSAQSIAAQYKAVGNAVPLPLAAAFGKSIFDSLVSLVSNGSSRATTGALWRDLWRKSEQDWNSASPGGERIKCSDSKELGGQDLKPRIVAPESISHRASTGFEEKNDTACVIIDSEDGDSDVEVIWMLTN